MLSYLGMKRSAHLTNVHQKHKELQQTVFVRTAQIIQGLKTKKAEFVDRMNASKLK